MSTATLPILTAINGLLDTAKELNEGIPEVTVVLGPSGYSKKGQKHGHFAPESWKSTIPEEDIAHEIELNGESLQRGAEATLGTLLHELAHAYAYANKITDTSNNGRYHNKKFKAIGESFGIELEQSDTIGWSITTLAEGTAEKYADGLKELETALTRYRVPQLKISKVAKKYLMQCPVCEDPVVTGKKWMERNEFNLRCTKHDEQFELIEE